jgi:hypothetical protein
MAEVIDRVACLKEGVMYVLRDAFHASFFVKAFEPTILVDELPDLEEPAITVGLVSPDDYGQPMVHVVADDENGLECVFPTQKKLEVVRSTFDEEYFRRTGKQEVDVVARTPDGDEVNIRITDD